MERGAAVQSSRGSVFVRDRNGYLFSDSPEGDTDVSGSPLYALSLWQATPF